MNLREDLHVVALNRFFLRQVPGRGEVGLPRGPLHQDSSGLGAEAEHMRNRNPLGLQHLEARHLVLEWVLARVGQAAIPPKVEGQSLARLLDGEKVGGSPAGLPLALDHLATEVTFHPIANRGLLGRTHG